MAYSHDDIRRMGLPVTENAFEFNVQKWKIIPTTSSKPDLNLFAHRLNCLGSFYYFMKIGLGRDRLFGPLHQPMCENLERPRLKEIIEYPRDHFKSTIHSEGFPMWRVLPFLESDERAMRVLGYGDEFIRWMQYAHRQDSKFLLVSETIKNAVKLGVRISGHYENNAFFRQLFPEILPDEKCVWTNDSLHHKRSGNSYDGEGTFDFIGVGAALQSRHYDGGIIQDDLVGKKALESEIEMENTIAYHQLIVGVMDSVQAYGNMDLDEIVVGNRWAYYDLSSWIRANEPYFRCHTHSALGGCCKEHPQGIPIFPTEFSWEKLERFRKRLGAYFFSCQFLNEPVNPVDIKFDTKYLRYYKFYRDSLSFEEKIDSDGVATGEKRYKVMVEHQVKDGQVIPDINPAKLKRVMIVDPNHSGNEGRCRSAITVTGIHEKPKRIYLLDVWAQASSPEVFIQTIFNMALAWKVTDIYIETIAAQKFLFYHLKTLLPQKRSENEFFKRVHFIELKTPKTKNAKAIRIESLGPIFERGEFFINESGQNEFLEEYQSYPAGRLRDVLDTLGYGPQVWDKNNHTNNVKEILNQRYTEYRELSART